MNKFKIIKTNKNETILVDADNFDYLNQWAWHLSDTGYAVRRNRVNGKNKTIRMHRLVMNAPDNVVVDHLNNNKIDNRKSNLRTCTHKQNTQNRARTLGYCFDNSRNKWMVKYKNQFYGRYNTKEEAIKVYQLAKSGVPYNKKRKKFWHLPTGVFYQFGKYRVRPQVNNIRYWLGEFNNIKEAKKTLESWRKEREV